MYRKPKMSDKERVIKTILNAIDCDFGFVCAVPGNWGIPESIVFKEESGLLRFINHLGASKVDVVKQGDMFYNLPVQPELLLHFNDVNLRLTIRRKDTIKDHYLSVVKERDELKRKVYNLFKGYEAINYGYDQEIKRIGPITAASFDEAVEAVYGLKFPLLKRENGKYIDTDGKTIFHKEQFKLY